jgi:cytochrome c2
MKKTLTIISALVFLYACSGHDEKKENESKGLDTKDLTGDTKSSDTKYADDAKGVGKFTNVAVGDHLDKSMADAGSKIYDLKCSSCHKLSSEKLVGPGWKGVTSRRKAEWVMNFVTNTDEMLNKNVAAQAMLEECLVRMPNQNLTETDARNIYEYMRKNDGIN